MIYLIQFRNRSSLNARSIANQDQKLSGSKEIKISPKIPASKSTPTPTVKIVSQSTAAQEAWQETTHVKQPMKWEKLAANALSKLTVSKINIKVALRISQHYGSFYQNIIFIRAKNTPYVNISQKLLECTAIRRIQTLFN